jgi:two-component system chemotaxis response regulator CheB
MELIITGIIDDGAKGTLQMKKQANCAIARYEKSCVVFGMPKAANQAAVKRMNNEQDR